MKQNKTNQINMTENSLKQNQMTANHNKAKKYQGLAKNTAHYTLECLYYFLSIVS